jgi:hypothetical protein
MEIDHQKRREEEAERLYNRRKALAHKEFAGLKIVTAGKPLQGPWYMLYLKPKWVLRCMPMPELEFIGHPEFWNELVDREIVPFYKITDRSKIAELKNIPYCMPRGRVGNSSKKYSGRMEWVASYGVDFNYTKEEKAAILSQFNLYSQMLNGQVRFLPDDHEVMLRYDHERFLNLITPLDPKNVKRINIQDRVSAEE